ncbi:hypothetical protein PENTCL1PPCAC_28018, partial [Pristionchus entomophagus]
MAIVYVPLCTFLMTFKVPTPACSQCTTCNQQPSQVYYNSQVAVQPSNQARPGYVNIQFQPPSAVSRNQQIYVWYGQPQPNQNQMNQALGMNGPQNNGGQPQYNPNGFNPNQQPINNQQPVMYNNVNRDQPNYANQPYNLNPNAQQQTPRPVRYLASTFPRSPLLSTPPSFQNPPPGFAPPQGVPSTAFPYSTTTFSYNTVAPLAPISQSFDPAPTYANSVPYYGPTSTAASPVTQHASSTPGPDAFPSSTAFPLPSSSSPSPSGPSPYLAEGFTPTPSPPSNTNDSSLPLAPLPVVFPSVSSSSVNVVPLSPAAPAQSNTVIISQTYSGPATTQTGLVGQAPSSSFTQTIVGKNQAPSSNEAPSQASFTQTVVGSQTQPQSGANPQAPISQTTFTFVGTNQDGSGQAPIPNVVGSDQAAFDPNHQQTGTDGSAPFGADQLPVPSQPGAVVTPLPVVYPANGPTISNQVGANQPAFEPNPLFAGANQVSSGSTGPQFQPNQQQSGSMPGQTSSAFVQDSGPAISRPVGSQLQFQPSPSASSDFSLQVSSQQQPVYNPALVTSQTAPVSNQYDFQQQQQQQQQAVAVVGGGSAAVAAAALAAAAAAGGSSNTTALPPTTFAYSTQFDQGTPMPTIQPVPTATQQPLVTGSMQPVTSTLAYNPPPSPSPTSSLASPPSPFSPSSSSTTRVPSSTTPAFPGTLSVQQQQQQVLHPSQQLQQQPLASSTQQTPTQAYSTTGFPYSTQFNQGTLMPTGTIPYSTTMAPMTPTMSPSTTTNYPSTTTMAPSTTPYYQPTTTTSSPMYTASPSTTQQTQFGNTLQPSQQLQQQPYVLGSTMQQPQQQQGSSTFAPYSTQGPQQSSTTPVQIGYNPAGQPQYGQPTSTQAPFVSNSVVRNSIVSLSETSSTPSTPYALSTTPYGSQYPMTGTPVNAGGIGVNYAGSTTYSQPYSSSTTPSPQQPFYSSTQQPFVGEGANPTTATNVYQIGTGVPGSTLNPQFNPSGVPSSTYSPYAVGGSTLGNQVLYDPSTGLVTANGMNTMYGRYTTLE